MTESTPHLFIADRVKVSRRVANLIAEEMVGRAPVLGLATGSSMELVYAELSDRAHASPALRAGAGRTHAFALDEYVDLPVDDYENSYRRTLERQFADPIGVPRHNLHVPGIDATGYETAIVRAGGIGLQLLGIGTNGHLAFNEPGSRLDARTRIVNLADQTRADNARFFAEGDTVPTRAVTQGIGTILEAHKLVVVVFGDEKAGALAAALTGAITAAVPASALRLHANVTIFADEFAAAQLPGFGHAMR